MPRFSVIITSFNQVAFIKDAVDSALAQPGSDKEVVVVDDGSTDGSTDLLTGYGHRIRLKILETNQGACAARNWGASLATGDFLVFLDGDDLLLPWALSVYDRIIEQRQPKLILGCMRWFKDSFASVHLGGPPEEIAMVVYDAYMKKDRAWRASASALVVERASFKKVGGWTENLFPGDDHDLVLRLGYSGRAIQVMRPETTAYRVHSTNTVHQVPNIMAGILAVTRREKAGCYPGGIARRFERHAVIGGVAFYWSKRGLKAGFYRQGLSLLAAGWWMILAALLRRAGVIVLGRRPIEKLTHAQASGSSSDVA